MIIECKRCGRLHSRAKRNACPTCVYREQAERSDE